MNGWTTAGTVAKQRWEATVGNDGAMSSSGPKAGEERDEIQWWSATETASRLRAREISSREVLEALVARTDRLDTTINAVVHRDLERAHEAARIADEHLVAGTEVGPLHGVPMTIKDSFMTSGCVTTSGAPEYADFVPEIDAAPVAALRDAGAIIWAKTNLPIYAGDIQSYNELYGTTVNPFDAERTCGGSSGGAAAALSMGFTSLELGSDIGGSIRVPAHYCGVAGHKPSYGIVPGHGQIPGPPGTLSQADLAVVGPMARTVDDLELALGLLSGPDRWQRPAWQLELPPPPHGEPRRWRVAAWLDDEACPVGTEVAGVLETLVAALDADGVAVHTEARPGFGFGRAVAVYERLLHSALSGGFPKDVVEGFAGDDSDSPLGVVRRATALRHREWLSDHERRLQLRARWEEFFVDFDVMLMPVQPCVAIRHDHSSPQFGREVEIDGRLRPYTDLFNWIGLAGVAYLPATVVPVGLSPSGLPVGVQVVAPFLGDRTALGFARYLEDLCGGCPRPELAAP